MDKKQKFIITLVSLLILVSGIIFNFSLYHDLEKQAISVGQPLVHFEEPPITTGNLQHMIHEAQKGIVQINVETEYADRFGSGFLFNTRGDIVTNAHVIEGATSIEVTLSNAETYPAAIVGISDVRDIAVIRVPQLINQRPIALETNERYLPGSDVIAVGSPLGFQNTVSIGIISGIDRSFDINGYNYENVYQISANITHGNSGGPLLDRHTGKVIGINSAGIEESEIGFSIPLYSVIDEITEWSSSTSNDQLTFPRNVKRPNADPKLLSDEASYLIDYFIDSISIHDYINAYTLIGSELQAELDYPSFRSNFLPLKSLRVIDYLEENLTQEKVDIILTIEHDDIELSEDRHLTEYLFTVGYENGQLKILNLQAQ